MTKAFDLRKQPDFVPLLNYDAMKEAARVAKLRADFKHMLESPGDFISARFEMRNREHLIHALEQVTFEDIADFILWTIDHLESETISAQEYADQLESELDATEAKLRGMES